MDQKRYFCAKNRIWCNNTLPLFGLNMRFFVVKIHQHYSGIEQQIHYRLCSRPWENSSHILGNGNLMTQSGVRTEYNCKEIQTKQPSWLKPQSTGKPENYLSLNLQDIITDNFSRNRWQQQQQELEVGAGIQHLCVRVATRHDMVELGSCGS